jgi:hypothetical protein
LFKTKQKIKGHTGIKAEVILASKNSVTGDILYTWRLTFPRIILCEILTHRAWSRSTSSSRAITGKRTRAQVVNDPFIPYYIGRKQSGMQAGEELRGWRRKGSLWAYSALRYPAVACSWLMELVGAPKQIANRVLEPWLWVVQIVSATDMNNFLLLRNHKDAEPHLRHLARLITGEVTRVKHVLNFFEKQDGGLYSGPYEGCQHLNPGEWHLPFLLPEERDLPLDTKKAVSAARSARTSYTLAGSNKVSDVDSDVALCKRLVGSQPLHASPVEMVAQALETPERIGNFRGFRQWRKSFEGENGGDLL